MDPVENYDCLVGKMHDTPNTYSCPEVNIIDVVINSKYIKSTIYSKCAIVEQRFVTKATSESFVYLSLLRDEQQWEAGEFSVNLFAFFSLIIVS